ncbi:ATP-binding protein [Chloroflexi bacterium TSY]|nr:ATP-binding protein [Chloroflexi bacterium TSY]
MGDQGWSYDGPLEEPAGEWFVNRKRDLDLLWKWASGIPHPGRNSYALVGLRRTGKTAILHKIFNRLYNEQDRILPVYISFVQYLNRPEPIEAYEFAQEYFAGYMRSYLAFRYRRPDFHHNKAKLDLLREFANEVADQLALELFKSYDLEPVNQRTAAHSQMQWVINFPKGIAWTHDMPTAMIVDEFQVLTRVYNPDNGMMRNLTDSFQHASETRHAPMLVSGSSVSMLVGDALGGMLSGRFKLRRLRPLAKEHAIDMVFRVGQVNGIEITGELALAIWEWTQGYPYSIEAILNSDCPAIESLPDVDRLDEIVLFELTESEGALWIHYESEYGKYVHELNGDDVTRKILLWIVNYPDDHIHPKRIIEAFDLDMLQVRESLDKLYQIDILDKATISTFFGPSDPLLREYLKYAHYVDVDDLPRADAAAVLSRELNRKQGQINRQTGHFTEIIVAGVMNNYDNRTVDGVLYFGHAQPVTLPRMETIERREGVIKEGVPHEIDVIGEYRLYNKQEGNAALGAWLVSVRYRQERMGEKEIDAFIQQTAAVQAEKGYDEITRWYFSKSGFTQSATTRLQDEGIYFSDLERYNALARLFGFLPLSM